jgi:hypothetical protein
MTFPTRKQLQERKKQQLRERKKQRRRERKERQLQERKDHQLQARQKQQQLQQQFIAEFVRRLREGPDGTRVYMRCGDVFAPLTGCDDGDDDATGHLPVREVAFSPQRSRDELVESAQVLWVIAASVNSNCAPLGSRNRSRQSFRTP